MSAPTPAGTARPRDASTVILLRDGAAGAEVYLLRRVRGMPFAGGMTAFPGGSVDPRDADVATRWAGPSPARWARRLSTGEPLARALVCAAVRETFEEAGVLLAGPAPDAVVDGGDPRWAEDRAALERHDLSLAELLDRRGLVLRSDLLRPWAHWITPAGEPRRYDTRFFVAALPAGQHTSESSSEADHVAWMRPADALAEAADGTRPMLPPTLVTLRELAECATAAGELTVAGVLAAADRRAVAAVEPVLEVDADGARVRLPGGAAMPVPPGLVAPERVPPEAVPPGPVP